MDWVVFNYSLPTKQGSTSRVKLWRRLQRLGAVSIAGGAYVLPAKEECLEGFQWLAQEIRSANGEALVMRVERFEGLPDQQLIDLFCTARAKDYSEIATQISNHTGNYQTLKSTDLSQLHGIINKLRRRLMDIEQIDYFNCKEGREISSRLDSLERRYSTPSANDQISSKSIKKYQDKKWVTRPHPHVDRLACVWFIRRFINPEAMIRYSLQPETDEVAFDMYQGEFGHRGNLCTFEVMKMEFGLEDAGLRGIAEIVHEIDLHDGLYTRSEIAGIETIINGWAYSRLLDTELESRGVALYEGLYNTLSRGSKGSLNSKGGDNTEF